jgi:hypothetical protein
MHRDQRQYINPIWFLFHSTSSILIFNIPPMSGAQ